MKISLAKLFFGAMAVSLGWDFGKAMPVVIHKLMSDEVRQDIKAAYNRGNDKAKAKARVHLVPDETPTHKTGAKE